MQKHEYHSDDLTKELHSFPKNSKMSDKTKQKMQENLMQYADKHKQNTKRRTIMNKVFVGFAGTVAITLGFILFLSNQGENLMESNLANTPNEVESNLNLNQLNVTTSYKEALKTANEFLIAWQNRDAQTGETLVTDELKNEKGQSNGDVPSELAAYFIGTSNPYHHSFEIVGKEKVDEDTYHFNVWMYEYYTGQDEETSSSLNHVSAVRSLEVVKVDENERGEGIWKVSNLP